MAYRVIITALKKRPDLDASTCAECITDSGLFVKGSRFICRGDLIEPEHEGVYWFLRPEKHEFYKKVLMEEQRRQWSEKHLEPHAEVLVKDGPDYFAILTLCRPKGVIDDNRGLVDRELSVDEARNTLLKELTQWEFQRV